MAVMMRLRRTGRKNRPFYRVVITDSRHPRDGRFIDTLGHYDPHQDPAEVEISEEKVLKWLGEGVEMSDTVRSILSREGILKRWHEMKSGKKEIEPKAEVKGESTGIKGEESGKATAKKAGKSPEK
jgi:small subunit ribosomal protein S16